MGHGELERDVKGYKVKRVLDVTSAVAYVQPTECEEFVPAGGTGVDALTNVSAVTTYVGLQSPCSSVERVPAQRAVDA